MSQEKFPDSDDVLSDPLVVALNDHSQDSDYDGRRDDFYFPNETELNQSWTSFSDLLKKCEISFYDFSQGYRKLKMVSHWVVSNLRAKQKSYFEQKNISHPTQAQINEFYRELSQSTKNNNHDDSEDDNNQFYFKSYLDLVNIYDRFSEVYKSRVMGEAQTKLVQNHQKYEEKKIIDVHLLFASIPGIHIIHAIVYCVNYWHDLTEEQEASPLTVIKVGAAFLGFLLAPVLDFLIIPYLIYDFSSSTIEYAETKKKYERRLEEYKAPMDELKGVFERLMACFDGPMVDENLKEATTEDFNKTLDALATLDINLIINIKQRITHRDEFMSLLLGEKFEGTNSTGIINIQNQLKQYPDMSSDRLFQLMQTEISQRVSQSGSMVSLFKEANRVPAMQRLYNLVNGGQFGVGQKLDLTQQDDREKLLELMKQESSFVQYETLNNQEIKENHPSIKEVSSYLHCSGANAVM